MSLTDSILNRTVWWRWFSITVRLTIVLAVCELCSCC